MNKMLEKVILLLLIIAAAAFGDDTSMVSQVVMNTTQTLLSQISQLVITAVIAVVSYHIKQFLQTSATVKKYNLDNDITERLLANSASYAEAVSKRYVDNEITKRQLAIKYLEKVSPDTISKYGDQIHDMLDRKVEQLKVDQKIRNQSPVQ